MVDTYIEKKEERDPISFLHLQRSLFFSVLHCITQSRFPIIFHKLSVYNEMTKQKKTVKSSPLLFSRQKNRNTIHTSSGKE